jgi:peptide/nickel transport system permease protein
MTAFLVRRLLASLLVLWGVSLLTFSLIYVVPGNPALAIAGDRAPQELLARIRQDLGLNDPLPVQYARYLGKLLHGDLGDSYVFRTPVATALVERFPVTLRLAVLAIVLRVLTGASLGLAAGLNRGKVLDRALMVGALVALSSPPFWLGLLLLYVFAYQLGWLPLGGHETWQHTVLPALTLTAGGAAWYGRVLRSNVLEVLTSDYVRTARAKGLGQPAVVWRHVARNALGPLLTMTGTDFGHFLGGVVVVETVFGWPGIGRLAWEAVQNLDGPMIMGTVLFGAVFVVLANLVVDVLYTLVDPRVSVQ